MAYKSNYNSYSYNPYSDPLNQQPLGYSNASKGAYGKYNNSRNMDDHGGMGQLEFMLQNQRKKFREAKQKFEYDLDNERKKRIEFQNKLIKLKDQFTRKEVTVSQLQFKINNLLHQNQDILLQNDRLKSELARLEELYGGKIQQLQAQLNMEAKSFEETTLQYNHEFDKFKKEGQDYVQQLTFELQRKIKGLQQKLKASEMARRDLAMENKKSTDLLISNRLQYEEELRDIKNRARDQEIKKGQYLAKGFQQKLKMVQDSKEALNRKIQELTRMLQDKDGKLGDIQRENADQLTRLRQQNQDLNQQVSYLNHILSKMRNQISDKDALIGRSVNDNDQELRNLRNQVEAKKAENAQLAASIRQLRLALKDSEGEAERKRRDLIDRCNALEAQGRKYKDEYLRICDILKSKINNTIDGVAYKK